MLLLLSTALVPVEEVVMLDPFVCIEIGVIDIPGAGVGVIGREGEGEEVTLLVEVEDCCEEGKG